MQSSGEQSARLVWQWGGHWYSLPLTPDDVLTLARAVEVEGYPGSGVAWTLLQRAAWLRTQGQNVSVGQLVRSYAQPINPAWFVGGEKHAAEVQRLENLGDTAGVAAERARALTRPDKARRPWGELSTETHGVIRDILFNRSKSPVIGAVHYWASRGPDFASNQKAKPGLILLDRGYGFGPGRNVFFAVKGSEQFGGLQVQNGHYAAPGDSGMNVADMSGLTSPLSWVLSGLVGYFLWKKFG